MPRVESAEQATELVTQFVKRHRVWGGRPISAKREESLWVVQIDVGLFEVKIGEVRLDAATGAVREYNLPP